MPEVDKLIAMSRLFGVSVGWLLGAEEQTADAQPEISGELVQKIEEIVLRYQPKKEPLSLTKIIAIVAVLAVGLYGLFTCWEKWEIENSMLQYTYAQVDAINAQNATIQQQLQALENRINNLSVVPDAAVSEAILADYSIRTELNLQSNTATVRVSAVPGTWYPGTYVSLSVRKDGAQVTIQDCVWDGSAYTAQFLLEIADGYEYWLVREHPDGAKEQTVLPDAEAEDLASTYTIGCEVTQGTARFDTARNQMHLENYDIHITNPSAAEHGDLPWKQSELVLVHIRDDERTTADTYQLFPAEEANEPMTDGQATAWTEVWCYPNGPLALPDMEDGDGLELWVMLEMENGIHNHMLITSWSYSGGYFHASQYAPATE